MMNKMIMFSFTRRGVTKNDFDFVDTFHGAKFSQNRQIKLTECQGGRIQILPLSLSKLNAI